MAGRNRRPMDDIRGFHDDPRPFMRRGAGPLPPHPAILEEELEIRHREMQKIVAENRHLVDENVFLQSELTAVKDEIHRLSQILPTIRAEKEAQTRELKERGLKLEAELHSAEQLRAEVVQLRAETQKLSALRQELSAQIQTLNKDINRCKADNQEVSAMKADLEGLHKEAIEARRVYESEKKANEELVEQNQAMDKNLVSMAREMEKLRAAQAGPARRSQVPGYGMMNGSPDMRYGGSSFGDVYVNGPWGSYDKRGPPRR